MDTRYIIGIDLGTSSVKAVLVDDSEQILAQASESLQVARPAPTHSEQDPASWWQATLAALDRLAAEAPKAMAAVTGIGLSGQMHGATLLDAQDRVLRPVGQHDRARLRIEPGARHPLGGGAAVPFDPSARLMLEQIGQRRHVGKRRQCPPQRLAAYSTNPNLAFWQNIKEGYDRFELAKVPPAWDVCEKKYVFDLKREDGTPLDAAAACPPRSNSTRF